MWLCLFRLMPTFNWNVVIQGTILLIQTSSRLMESFFLQHNQEKSYLFLDFRRLFFVFVFSPTFFIFNLGSAFFAILVSFTLLLDRIAIKLKQFVGVEFSELGYKVPKIATKKKTSRKLFILTQPIPILFHLLAPHTVTFGIRYVSQALVYVFANVQKTLLSMLNLFCF